MVPSILRGVHVKEVSVSLATASKVVGIVEILIVWKRGIARCVFIIFHFDYCIITKRVESFNLVRRGHGIYSNRFLIFFSSSLLPDAASSYTMPAGQLGSKIVKFLLLILLPPSFLYHDILLLRK